MDIDYVDRDDANAVPEYAVEIYRSFRMNEVCGALPTAHKKIALFPTIMDYLPIYCYFCSACTLLFTDT